MVFGKRERYDVKKYRKNEEIEALKQQVNDLLQMQNVPTRSNYEIAPKPVVEEKKDSKEDFLNQLNIFVNEIDAAVSNIQELLKRVK